MIFPAGFNRQASFGQPPDMIQEASGGAADIRHNPVLHPHGECSQGCVKFFAAPGNKARSAFDGELGAGIHGGGRLGHQLAICPNLTGHNQSLGLRSALNQTSLDQQQIDALLFHIFIVIQIDNCLLSIIIAPMWKALLKTMRPLQWSKNGFLFVGLIFDRKLNNVPALLTTIAGVGIFCLIASSVYILNDLADLEEDRRHPKKRHRPLAVGVLPVRVAVAALVVFLALAFPAAYLLNPAFFIICLIYFVSNLIYSNWFKHIPLLDVLLLAGFYVIRVAAGVTLIDVERFSPWLYLFTTFIALFLGIGKRRAELVMMAESPASTRRVLDGYTLPFLDQLFIVVSTLTIITYSLYTFSAPNLPENDTMMFTIPFLIYGLFRYLYLVHVEEVGEAPEEVLFRDRPLQVALILFGISILIIFYVL